ncbi:MAG TPA: hypothetical protein VGC72_10360 [Candidatus Elarobacter sp.]
MTKQTVSRVHYFDKQFLRVAEFSDEQLYQLALRRRHNVTEHTWGIATGLEIAQESGGLVVLPGVAIDGYGREVLLAAKKTLHAADFDTLGSDRLDVWIAYDRRDASAAPSGYGACSPAGSEAYRSDEIPQILVERPLTNVVDARRPPGIPAAVLDAPVPLLSDDPADTWRVYLGRVTRLQDGTFRVDASQRTYVGCVAETIDHPANGARVEIGKQSRTADRRTAGGVTYTYAPASDPATGYVRQFAVFAPDQQNIAAPQLAVTLTPRFEILQNGTTNIRGETVVEGSVRVAGAVEFRDAAQLDRGGVPANPAMYRMLDAAGNDELRIDLSTKATPGTQFVIGFSKSDGTFTPCLAIELRDDGSGTPSPLLTVMGDLRVEGKIDAQFVPRALSGATLAAALAAFQSAVASAPSPS